MRTGGRTLSCRGVFISVEDVDSYESVEDFANQLSSCGVDSVFLEAEEYPRALIRALHEYGMRFFASLPIFSDRRLLMEFPELAPVDRDGRTMGAIEGYVGLCPTNKWYRRDRLEALSELARQVDVDGVWLDFIRYPCRWEKPKPFLEQYCFCRSCQQKFSKERGVPLTGETLEENSRLILTRHLEEWVEWKCGVIAGFVAEAKKRVTKARPGIPLGIFAVPWRGEDFGGAIRSIIGQDFKLLSEWVDIFSPMAYHGLCGRDVKWVGEIAKYMIELTRKRTWTAIQSYDISAEKFGEALSQGAEYGSDGVLVFHWSGVRQSKKRMKTLSSFFKIGNNPMNTIKHSRFAPTSDRSSH